MIVIGSGVAGLSAAYSAAVSSKKKRIGVFSKSIDSSSMNAQGGIACALGEMDSWKSQYGDTLKAGAGLCDKNIAEILAKEGIVRIRELIELGLEFDSIDGKISFGLEACHSMPRVLHINGDQTGKALTEFLKKLCNGKKSIEFFEKSELIELIKSNGKISGAVFSKNNELIQVNASAVILASGGCSSLWKKTTNPKTSTGEAITIAFNAGAMLKNLEFEQFHPTTLAMEWGENFLISEGVRGEGAILLNDLNERFMEKISGKELASRDIVSMEIYSQIISGRKAFLDIRPKGKAFLKKRFPKIYSELKKFGIKMESDLIPIEPAAHYSIGGIQSNEFGETNLKSLFAIGECSCNGLHGANRLASNSLLEGIVFGNRAGKKAVKAKPAAKNLGKKQEKAKFAEKIEFNESKNSDLKNFELKLKETMWQYCGIARTGNGLKDGLKKLRTLEQNLPKENSIGLLKFKNQLKLSQMIMQSALNRKKSIGCHCIKT